MSSFSADWLALREPYDARARSPEVLDAVAGLVAGHTSVMIVDLACGTGSMLRAISHHLPTRQNWRLVDNDLGLLARAAASARPAGARVTTALVDLARDLETVLDGPVDLVTTTGLLDLVSADWFDRLAIEAAARRIPVYASLTFDGRIKFEPSDVFDAAIIAALNAHQRGDKGFGPALGPTAAATAIARLEALGYAVMRGAADWVLGPKDREIQTELLGGWADAAREVGNLSLGDVIAWLARRRDVVADGCSSMQIGHIDFFAWPIGVR